MPQNPLSAAFNQKLIVITFLNKSSFDTFCHDTPRDHLAMLTRAAPDDTIIAAFLPDGRLAGFASYRDEDDIRNAGLIEVDESVRDMGVAKRLLRSAMAAAEKDGMTIRFSYFTDMGRDAFAKLLPRLHREFPELKVQYLGCPDIFTGHKPYTAPIPAFDM